MKIANRALALTLTAILASSSIACGGSGDTADTTPTAAGDTTTAAPTETVDPALVDELPEKNYDGREFRIASQSRSWFRGTWTTEEENGETLNDAIYKRNQAVEERFNIKLVETILTDESTVSTALRAGDDQYDITHSNSGSAIAYAQEGLLLGVDDLPYVDLDKAYWDKSINDALTFGDSRFFAVGALDLTGYDYCYAMLFNKKLVEDNKLENPYDLVKSGDWTFDTYDKMVKNVTNDIDGNTVYDDKDMYGLTAGAKQVLPTFWIGAGVRSVNTDEDGYPVFNMDADQRFSEVIEKTFEITYDNNSWFRGTTEKNMFFSDQALFNLSSFFGIEKSREYDTDFGIIPYPKFDKEQEKYYSRVEGINLMCIPTVVPDPEFVSIIFEALTCESKKTVIPAYYEVSLKTKAARDVQSGEMLDLIFENRVFDLGDTIWCSTVRDGVFAGMFESNDRALASKIASLKTAVNEKIDATVAAFEKLS